MKQRIGSHEKGACTNKMSKEELLGSSTDLSSETFIKVVVEAYSIAQIALTSGDDSVAMAES